jgi:hypothetical protein
MFPVYLGTSSIYFNLSSTMKGKDECSLDLMNYSDILPYLIRVFIS